MLEFSQESACLRKRQITRSIWSCWINLGNLAIWVQFGVILAFLPFRYLFLGNNMVDCVMDGLQNVIQLQNRTYLERVRNICATYGIPPTYMRTIDHFYMRMEPRNQTFVESIDYFLAKERELFNFRMSCFHLGLAVLLLLVKLSFSLKSLLALLSNIDNFFNAVLFNFA